MTLATHIVIAAAVTKNIASRHPVLGFFAAIASHYLSDAIPHWDYSLRATEYNEDMEKLRWGRNRALMWRDLRHFALDGFIGAAVVLIAIRPVSAAQWTWAGLSIVGGVLPDFLQGLYFLGMRFLLPLQRFHDLAHTKMRLGPYPLIGIPFQALIFLLAVFVLS